MRTLLVACCFLVFAGPAAAACPSAAALEGEVMCPTCKTTLDQSDAPAARQIKLFIRERAERCVSEQQIKDELVAQFGPAVLAAPPREGFHWLAWLLPIGGLLLGAGLVSLLVWRWSRARPAAAPVAEGSNGRVPLDPELEQRLDRELARFDG